MTDTNESNNNTPQPGQEVDAEAIKQAEAAINAAMAPRRLALFMAGVEDPIVFMGPSPEYLLRFVIQASNAGVDEPFLVQLPCGVVTTGQIGALVEMDKLLQEEDLEDEESEEGEEWKQGAKNPFA